jgi:hypothetical protein
VEEGREGRKRKIKQTNETQKHRERSKAWKSGSYKNGEM